MASVAAKNNRQFSWQVRVYYEDTDSGGVVYHSNYLNFMERARTECLRSLGLEQTYLKDELNVIFVVHSLQMQFKKPAKFNDLLTISTEIEKVGHGSFDFLQKITENTQFLVSAQVKVACVSTHTFKPVAIPKSILLTME